MSGINRIPLRFLFRIKDMDKKIKKQKMAKKTATTITAPAAWIVNSNDRGRKSIKKGKVYLQDKEEFQIELYNTLQNCVLADIKLNGNSISKSGLVLNPGQRFYLDCFIDDKKKFIFNTYDVDQTDEVKEAIAKNGLLEVFFYKESVVNLENWSNRFYWFHSYPRTIWGTYGTPYWGGNYYGTGITTGVCNTTTTAGNFNLTNVSTSNAYYSSTMPINSSYTSDLSLTSSIGGSTKSMETGRIEKGQKSQQKFESIDMDFDKYYIASTILQILPESRKPVETKEIGKERRITSWSSQEKNKSEDVIELIKKLAELHKVGILTDEEFATKKVELLSKI